jgi:hypothetical protein
VPRAKLRSVAAHPAAAVPVAAATTPGKAGAAPPGAAPAAPPPRSGVAAAAVARDPGHRRVHQAVAQESGRRSAGAVPRLFRRHGQGHPCRPAPAL